MNKTLTIILLWLPTVIYLGLIYYLSSLSHIKLSALTPPYFMHCLEYFILLILMVRAFNSGLMRKVTRGAIIAGIIFSISYAALDEIHQLYVPERTASILDLISDAAGVLLGIVFILVVQKYRQISVDVIEKIPGSK